MECPKCGKEYTKKKNLYNHIEICPGLPLCKCGCGKKVSSFRNMYICGHNNRGKPFVHTEARSVALRKAWSSKSEGEKREIGRKISRTKNTPEGKLKAKLAYLKCKDRIKAKLKGLPAHNKLEDSQKVLVKCLNCGKEKLEVPSIAKTKKYCSRKCKSAYRKGKPHLGYNILSHINNLNCSYGISGRYKGILFRSSYELSFLVRASQLGHIVSAEPVIIELSKYLSPIDREIFCSKPNRKYIPDYLLNGNCLVEIKPEYQMDLESEGFSINIAKLLALKNYSKQNNLSYLWLTDEDMGELLLTTKQIQDIPKIDITFFKEKHQKRFAQKLV